MRALDKLRLRFSSLFRRGKVEAQLDDELRFHLDQLTEENIAGGMAPEEARRMAQLTTGNVGHLKDECRDLRRVYYIDDLLRDLRYGSRTLAAQPSAVPVTCSVREPEQLRPLSQGDY